MFNRIVNFPGHNLIVAGLFLGTKLNRAENLKIAEDIFYMVHVKTVVIWKDTNNFFQIRFSKKLDFWLVDYLGWLFTNEESCQMVRPWGLFFMLWVHNITSVSYQYSRVRACKEDVLRKLHGWELTHMGTAFAIFFYSFANVHCISRSAQKGLLH